MRLDEVFIGFTKDGEERVFYKKYDIDMGVDFRYATYIDLETKKEYNISHDHPSRIDEKTLIPIKRVLGLENNRMRKRKVMEAYRVDRNVLVNTKDVFYGDICKIIEEENSHKKKLIKLKGHILFLREHTLFTRAYDGVFTVQDLYTSERYRKDETDIGTKTVREYRPIYSEVFDEYMQPKRKVLEMDYKGKL